MASTSTACRRTSPVSWTQTVAGPSGGACPAPRDTPRGRRRCSTPSRAPSTSGLGGSPPGRSPPRTGGDRPTRSATSWGSTNRCWCAGETSCTPRTCACASSGAATGGFPAGAFAAWTRPWRSLGTTPASPSPWRSTTAAGRRSSTPCGRWSPPVCRRRRSPRTAIAASGACAPVDAMLYHDRGVVLRTHKLGEADRIVTFLTRDNGKVRAVAKGVRKTKSRFGGRLEPPSHAQLLLYQGRELDIVSQAETIDHFRPVRDDLDRLGRAVSMLEAADQRPRGCEPNPRLYEMLVGALRALSDQDAPLVLAGFFLKVLALEGFRPQVEACVVCGDDGPLVSWAIEEGGLRCAAHRQGPALSPEAVDVLQHALGGRLGTALNETRGSVVSEVDHLVVRAVEHHLERRLRSVTALHRT